MYADTFSVLSISSIRNTVLHKNIKKGISAVHLLHKKDLTWYLFFVLYIISSTPNGTGGEKARSRPTAPQSSTDGLNAPHSPPVPVYGLPVIDGWSRKNLKNPSAFANSTFGTKLLSSVFKKKNTRTFCKNNNFTKSKILCYTIDGY